MQRTVKRVGFDKMPLNDPELRPILKHLYGYAERVGLYVWSFDIPEEHPGRLFHGMVSPHQIQLAFHARKLQEEMVPLFTREVVLSAKPVFASGARSCLYFENIWTPIDALDGMSN